ncbi:MAG: CcdB family protein [Ramlibacter sp.]|nr:CcdB family protein [Ramlibacter sp.]
MAQFDIHENPYAHQRTVFPYVVEVQHDFFDQLPTRLVMPLQRARISVDAFPRRLTETIRVQGENVFPAAHLMAPLPAKILRKAVASAKDQQNLLRDAIDALQSGV